MSKKEGAKSSSNLLSFICFILFIVWAVATILQAFDIGLGANVVRWINTIAHLAAFIALGYFAYAYYYPRRKNTVIAVLFWIAIIVGVVAVIIPMVA